MLEIMVKGVNIARAKWFATEGSVCGSSELIKQRHAMESL